ncbi:hypothetical protein ACQ4PT_069720 [Festuca glaucescens]
MQYVGPTFVRLHTVQELRYPPGILVERTLHVWAQSRLRGPIELADTFFTAGFAHLLPGSPAMFHLDEVRDGVSLKLLTVTLTNPWDAYELLGQVFCHMTIGKMLELVGGKAGASCGRFHYGSAFGEPSGNADKVQDMSCTLVKHGFNYQGKDLLYSDVICLTAANSPSCFG